MGDPTAQRQVAKLLARAMGLLGISGAEMERRTGINRQTITQRYCEADYESGPPKPHTLRRLEAAMGVPLGYLDGTVTMSDVELVALGSTHVPSRYPPKSQYDPAILQKVRDAGLTELDRIKRGSMVDIERAMWWLNELYNVAMEIYAAPTADADARTRHGRPS